MMSHYLDTLKKDTYMHKYLYHRLIRQHIKHLSGHIRSKKNNLNIRLQIQINIKYELKNEKK